MKRTPVKSSRRKLAQSSVTKKNFNKMVLESGIMDGKWKLSEVDIVATLKRDSRFQQVVEEKLKGYQSQPYNNLVKGLKKYRAAKEDVFTQEQVSREKKWKPDSETLNLEKETYQLQPLFDHGNIDEYCVESVQAGGIADIVLTAASTQTDSLFSWTEKLSLPVYLPIEAKCSFTSSVNSNQRQHTIHDLSGHKDSAALISLYQYDTESQPRLFAVILAKTMASILRYLKVSSTGVSFITYTPTFSKLTGMLTKIQFNDNMKKLVKDKDVLVRTINDFTADQLESAEWIIRQFIAWADPASTLTIADFQSDSLCNQKGNIGEELTSIAFHSVDEAVSRQGVTLTYDKVDLWMVIGGVEVSISCKTVGTLNKGNLKSWRFPLTEKLNGKKNVPVTFERSCDVWTATLHYDLIEPNISSLKAPDGTHWILFLFTKPQLKDRLGLKNFLYLKAGEHLGKAIYFDANKKILNPDAIDRLVAPLFKK